MPLVFLLALQAAAPAPDIELDIRVTARDVRIEQRGESSLEVRAGPDAGSRVEVDKPEAAGRRRLRNVSVRVKGEARIGDPANISAAAETRDPD